MNATNSCFSSKNLCIRGLPFDATAIEFMSFVGQSRTCAAIFEDSPPRAAITSFVAGKSPNVLKDRSAVNSTAFIIVENTSAAEQIAAALDGIALRPTTDPNLVMSVEYSPSQEPPICAAVEDAPPPSYPSSTSFGQHDTNAPSVATVRHSLLHGSIYTNPTYLEFVSRIVSSADSGTASASSKVSELNGGQTLEAWLQSEKQRDEDKKQTQLVKAVINKFYHKIPLAWEVRSQRSAAPPSSAAVSSSAKSQTAENALSHTPSTNGAKVHHKESTSTSSTSQRHKAHGEEHHKSEKDGRRSRRERERAIRDSSSKIASNKATSSTSMDTTAVSGVKPTRRRDETSKERRERKRRSDAAKKAKLEAEAASPRTTSKDTTAASASSKSSSRSASSKKRRGTRGGKKHRKEGRGAHTSDVTASSKSLPSDTTHQQTPEKRRSDADRAERRERLKRRMDVVQSANDQRQQSTAAAATTSSAPAAKNVFTVSSTRSGRGGTSQQHADPDAVSIPRPKAILRSSPAPQHTSSGA